MKQNKKDNLPASFASAFHSSIGCNAYSWPKGPFYSFFFDPASACSPSAACPTDWHVPKNGVNSYLYLHDLYTEMSDIYFMICVHYCPVLEMICILSLELCYPFQYSYICSSMMSVHPKGGGSTRDIRVLLVDANVVSGLIKCYRMSPFLMVCRGSLWWQLCLCPVSSTFG